MKKILRIILLALITIDALAQTQGWVETKKMSVPRARMATVTAGGKVYMAGGVANGNPYNSIDVYDTLTGIITPLGKNLRLGRADLAAVYNEESNRIFFVGGNTNGGKTTSIEVWDIAANDWAAELTLPKATAYMCAASYGSKVLFAGGANNTTYFDDLYVYDASGGSPRTYHLSEPRDQIAVVVIDSFVIMAGGHKENNAYSDKVEVFNLKTETWVTQSLTLSVARAFLSGASSGKRAFFGGGRIADKEGTKAVDVFDLSGNPSYVGQMQLSKERYYLSATSVGSKVFIAGGGEETPPHYPNVDIFDVSGATLPTNPTTENLSIGRSPITAVSVGTKAVFAGGNSTASNVYSDVVDIYDTRIIRPTITNLDPLDNSTNVTNVGNTTNLVITFSERIKTGSGNVTVKVNGEALPAIQIPSSAVTVIDNNKLNIVVNGIKTESDITVEMSADAVKDVDGNNYIAPTDVWNFQTGKIVTSTVNNPAMFEVGSVNDVTVSISLSAEGKLSGVPRLWSRGIADDPNDLEESANIPQQNGNSYEVTIQAEDFNDPIGLYFVFKYTDITGTETVTPARRIYLRYTTEKSEAIDYHAGSERNDYRIISIPMKLEQDGVLQVFNTLAPYDKKRWRLYDYAGEDNREYTGSTNSFTKIEAGKGYWLLTTFEGDIKPGAGTTVPFSDETNDIPYRIQINKGWNLIGNPYNFNISWEKVLAYNDADDVSQISTEVQIYGGGNQLAPSDVIDRHRGAFVLSNRDQSVFLKIPVRKEPVINRINSNAEVDLSSYNWQLPLELTDGDLINSTGGIGMNKNATLSGLDKFDRVQAPIPSAIGMFRMDFAHSESDFDFVKEVVPTSSSHIWDVSLVRTSDKVLTLTWDQSAFKESDNQLFLVDASFGSVKDMKAEGSYTVPSSTNNLKILFGNTDFILESLDKLLPVVGFPYPNPATNEVHIPFHVPSKLGSLDVTIEVFSSQGLKVITLANGTYEKGDHEVVWNTSGKSGLYIVETKIANRPTRTKVVVK